MIATLRLEAIGDNYRRLDAAPLKKTLYEVRRRPEHAQRLLDPKALRPWVAEISGTDPRNGLARKFLKGMRDYRDANGAGSRGVFVTFVLYPEKIYEVNQGLSWTRKRRYFCRVEQGRILELTPADVAVSLKVQASAIQAVIDRAARA